MVFYAVATFRTMTALAVTNRITEIVLFENFKNRPQELGHRKGRKLHQTGGISPNSMWQIAD